MKKNILKQLIRVSLKFHNFFYGLSGLLSQRIEPDNLHPKHRLMDYHRWFTRQLDPGWSVLDAGCGNGALSVDLSAHCKHVLGVDISAKNIEEAKKRKNEKLGFICADVTTYQFNQYFDAVVLSNVLEHIKERQEFLKKISSLSKRFLIRVPMIDRDWITLYKKEMGVEYRLDPTHFIEYTLEGLIDELAGCGFKIKDFRVRYGEIYAAAEAVKQ